MDLKVMKGQLAPPLCLKTTFRYVTNLSSGMRASQCLYQVQSQQMLMLSTDFPFYWSSLFRHSVCMCARVCVCVCVSVYVRIPTCILCKELYKACLFSVLLCNSLYFGIWLWLSLCLYVRLFVDFFRPSVHALVRASGSRTGRINQHKMLKTQRSWNT